MTDSATLPTYVVLLTMVAGEYITDLPTSERIVARYRPEYGQSWYIDALQHADWYRMTGSWAIVVDTNDLDMYEP